MAMTAYYLCVSLALTSVFVTLGSFRVLLIKFSANEAGTYDYLPVTVNVCAELIKFLVSFVLSIQVFASGEKSISENFHLTKSECIQTMKWSIPGLLYFIDNLLAFYIIRYFDPAVVVLLGNFVIITTSVLFRVVLKRKLSYIQWASLGILFLSIITLSETSRNRFTLDYKKTHAINHVMTNSSFYVDAHLRQCHPDQTQFGLGEKNSDKKIVSMTVKEKMASVGFHKGHGLVLLQCAIASMANIYNEKILKEGSGLKDSIYVQNSKLYFFGVFFNVLTVILQRYYRQKVLFCGFFHGYNKYSWLLIFVTAFHGLNVGFILKFRDNMFHVLSAQLMTVTVISLSIYCFNFQPQLQFYLSAPVVLLAIFIFKSSQWTDPAQEEVRITQNNFIRLRRSSSSSSTIIEEGIK